MPAIPLTQFAQLNSCSEYSHIELIKPYQILSSAVLNGGLTHAQHLLNIKVPKTSQSTTSADETLRQYGLKLALEEPIVGMMTAASMSSLRIERKIVQEVELAVVVTSGLSNARHVGDYAEYRSMTTTTTDTGTINIIVLSSATLSSAAMVEALMIATEAKAAALTEANVLSPISQQVATGTGTDAIAIVNGDGEHHVHYCGKHVLFGQLLGQMVKDTVTQSISWDVTHNEKKLRA